MTARRVFYITCDELVIYLCKESRVQEEMRFFRNDGTAPFEEYLSKERDVISCILLDIIEEEYRYETLPHTSRRDRKAILQRKLAKAFRGARWRDGVFQGCEKEGKRRSDKFMLSAITNSEILEYWLEVINKSCIPLEGIYSVAMMGCILLKQLKLKKDNTLLLTQQRGSLLRQTFLNGHNLKLSRLANIPIFSMNRYGDSLSREISRQLRYLNRISLLPYGQHVDIFVVIQKDMMEHFINKDVDSNPVNYHLLDMKEVAQSIGLKETLIAGMCEPLYAYLLTLERPSMNYASSYDRRYFFMKKARSWLLYGGIILAFASLLWGFSNILSARTVYKNTLDERAETEQIIKRYDEQLRSLPELPVTPSDMRFAVETNSRLQEHKSLKYGLFTISGSLSVHKDVQVDEIVWRSEVKQPDGDNAEYTTEAESASKAYHSLVLKAHLSPFNGNYRQAFQRIESFIDTIAAHPDISAVKALSMPLDIDSSSYLKGEMGFKDKVEDPGFEVLISFEDKTDVSDETAY